MESFWTPKAAKVAALALTDLTPGRAEALFRQMATLPASKSSFDRLPKALGARWEPQREHNEAVLRAREQVPPNAVSVALSCDGVMVAMNDNRRRSRKAESRARGDRDSGPTGHREATVGAISFYDAQGERIATRRVARMPEKGQATLREQLRAELRHVPQQRADLRLVAVADGARGVWGFLGKIGADAEVVDFYHAAEHLKDALDKLMGATSPETHQRSAELRHVLLNAPDGVDKVIVALEELERARKGRGRLARSARYFRHHRDRMRYASLRANHLPIGSGVIEGTCKSIVSDRLKRAGMRWSQPGGQAILTLRALSQSDRFDRGWDLLKATYVADVADRTAAAA